MAARKCARRKAAPLLLKRVACASRMVLVEHASLMDALPVQVMDLSIASNTAERRASRALWRAAPPLLLARVSVPNTAVAEKINAGLRNAHPYQSANATSAQNMVGLVSAHTHQDAARLQSRQVATARGTPASTSKLYTAANVCCMLGPIYYVF